jgi:hypothetical protein
MREGGKRAIQGFETRQEAETAATELGEERGHKYVVEQRKTSSIIFGRKEDLGIISHQVDGKPVYVKYSDPMLFEALSQINAKAFNSGILKVMTFAKRLLTFWATFTPAFRIANLIRDTIHTAVAAKGFTPFMDTAKGLVKVWRESPEYIALMASGGGFGQGYLESGDPKAMARGVEKILKREGQGARGNILDTPRRLLDLWQRIGHASEMAARVQHYSNIMARGEGHLEGSFQARDLLDFQKSGASNAMRVITATTPFLNARIQGLDRIYRGAKESPKAFLVKGALVAGASLLLWSLFKDDDRYKELEDWEKWQYHHLWIGNTHVRIPKAFEVGAIFSTLTETMGNTLSGNEDWDFFGRFLWHTLRQTFAVDVPTVFGPSLEVYANKSAFTGRPIESMAQQRFPSGERANPWTPELLKDLGKGLNISPLKMEKIIRGHTAAFGAMFLTVADAGYRLATDAPPRPALRIEDIPGAGRFIRGEDSRTKYATRYYEFAREVGELTATINNYKNLGDYQKSRKIALDNKDSLRYKKLINMTNKRLADLRKQEKAVWSSRKMTRTEKKLELRRLYRKKNRIYQEAYGRIYE